MASASKPQFLLLFDDCESTATWKKDPTLTTLCRNARNVQVRVPHDVLNAIKALDYPAIQWSRESGLLQAVNHLLSYYPPDLDIHTNALSVLNEFAPELNADMLSQQRENAWSMVMTQLADAKSNPFTISEQSGNCANDYFFAIAPERVFSRCTMGETDQANRPRVSQGCVMDYPSDPRVPNVCSN